LEIQGFRAQQEWDSKEKQERKAILVLEFRETQGYKVRQVLKAIQDSLAKLELEVKELQVLVSKAQQVLLDRQEHRAILDL
jgi:predicted DsbA family dithiol-disulfide isomerase